MELAAIRRDAGFNGQELADTLGWDQSKVSRIEKGKQAVEEIDLISWLTTCKVKTGRLRHIVEHNRVLPTNVWARTMGSFRYTVAEESWQAKTISHYGCRLVPGLLQTEDYIRALGTHANPSDPTKTERLVAWRTARQEVLRGEKAPHTYFYIEESALRLRVGTAQVMYDQLIHLMFMAEWTKVSIRIVPTAAGLHGGTHGEFELFKRRDTTHVVHTDILIASIFIDDPAEIKKYQAVWTELSSLVLSAAASKELIRAIAEEWASRLM